MATRIPALIQLSDPRVAAQLVIIIYTCRPTLIVIYLPRECGLLTLLIFLSFYTMSSDVKNCNCF